VVNLSVLETFDAGATVDIAALKAKGYVADVRHHQGVKILGTGELTKKLTLKVHAISGSARQKIEAAGGAVEIVS
jgi:large subunit ribosomal protein L15